MYPRANIKKFSWCILEMVWSHVYLFHVDVILYLKLNRLGKKIEVFLLKIESPLRFHESFMEIKIQQNMYNDKRMFDLCCDI